MTIGMEAGLTQAILCSTGTQLPLKGTQPPQFSAYVCCRQMAGWIKVPLSMDVDLGPGDIVLDRDLALPKGAQQPPQSLTHVYCGQRLDGSRRYLVQR